MSAVSTATGVARSTIGRGLAELRRGETPPSDRIRRPGGGRKQKVDIEHGLLDALSKLVESAIRGDPESPLLWVSKSQRHLAGALAEQGFTASQTLVGRLLRRLGFSLQANRKTSEGTSHPDRNAQFEHINMLVNAFQASRRRDSLPSRSTRKRRSLSQTSRTTGVNYVLGDIPSRFGCMISPFQNLARYRLMACMTLLLTPAGSISV